MSFDDAYDFDATLRADNTFETLEDIERIERKSGVITTIVDKNIRFTVDNLLSDAHLIICVNIRTSNYYPTKNEDTKKCYSKIDWLPFDASVGEMLDVVRNCLEKIKQQIIGDEHPISFFED